VPAIGTAAPVMPVGGARRAPFRGLNTMPIS
jgi:hypothetical protein